MDFATQVLAYRNTYEITDQVIALGAEPDEYVPRRTSWHRELNKEPRRWQPCSAKPCGVSSGHRTVGSRS
ncbi:hypothetical protein [Streptomyces orinoci]|uniref:Uncharacterized protein n=1 Tax=Streptomyces orinoci TaxID=67339 RepID=A0ABV3K0Z2_STRON|nr:hypothetical protein [Streptomyces orinoci]